MSQLVTQLVIGGALIVAATAVQAVTIGLAMMFRPRLSRLIRKMHLGVLAPIIAVAALWMLFGEMLGVWIWAWALMLLGAFDGIEPSLYFTLAAYTTLGFGDVLPPEEWRILGAMIGANGMLGFGLATAALIEFVRGLRGLH